MRWWWWYSPRGRGQGVVVVCGRSRPDPALLLVPPNPASVHTCACELATQRNATRPSTPSSCTVPRPAALTPLPPPHGPPPPSPSPPRPMLCIARPAGPGARDPEQGGPGGPAAADARVRGAHVEPGQGVPQPRGLQGQWGGEARSVGGAKAKLGGGGGGGMTAPGWACALDVGAELVRS